MLICANLDCPTNGHPQRACCMPAVVLVEGHSRGRQKPIRVNLCFECYYTHLRQAEKPPIGSDYPRREVCAR
jgi:hypothetical protein